MFDSDNCERTYAYVQRKHDSDFLSAERHRIEAFECWQILLKSCCVCDPRRSCTDLTPRRENDGRRTSRMDYRFSGNLKIWTKTDGSWTSTAFTLTNFLMTLDVVLNSTVPTGSREDTEYIIICDVYFRQDFVSNRWSENCLDQHDYAHTIESLQWSSSARDDQTSSPDVLNSNRDNEDTQLVTESFQAVLFSFSGLSLSSSSFWDDLLRRYADRTAERRKSE